MMDQLPELPFELMLSYMSLQDRLRSRAVSRAWKTKIDQFRVKSLCYSKRPKDFIYRKRRWVSGAFAENFICSIRFALFFNTFSRSTLSNLKHLRICDLYLSGKKNPTEFTKTLNSFCHLEELDIIRSSFRYSDYRLEFELSLPMLKSIHFERFFVDRLTLDAPRLQKVRIHKCMELYLDLVAVESVERVTIDKFEQIPVKQLKNLKQLYVRSSYRSSIDPTLLSSLSQLKEVYLNEREHLPEIFEQKRRYDRAYVKVYLSGLLLDGPEHPVIASHSYSYQKFFLHLAANQSRLAEEIPFYSYLHYSTIECVTPEVATNVLKRLTDLTEIIVDEQVRDTERFLLFLRTFGNIARLSFLSDQPRDLFDRLPEHSAVQKLTIQLPPDPQFLYQLKHLNELYTGSLNADVILRVLEKLQLISLFEFSCIGKRVKIEPKNSKFIDSFHIWIHESSSKILHDPYAAVQYIVESTRSSI